MKTKEEILEWLDKQRWKAEFYKAVFLYGTEPMHYDSFFIGKAFDWTKTKQGKDVWRKRDDEYLKWYVAEKPLSWEMYCKLHPIT